MAPQPLPPISLPLRFSLQSPLGSSSSPTACLSCLLPFRPRREHLDAPIEGSVEDVREGAERAAVEVVRILDPEHREPFISLARIFLAVCISPLEGLLLYPELRRPAYDSTLAGIAPFIDLWVPLKTATAIAEKLGLADELAGLLEWSSRLAYSVEDKEAGGMVHNWKIGSDKIDPARYSTSAMLSTSFTRIHLLPQGSQVRTLLPPPLTASPFATASFPSTFPSLYSHIVDWSISEYESYISAHSPGTSAALNSPQLDSDLAPSLLFTSLLSLLSLTGQVELEQPSGSTYVLPGLRIDRSEVGNGSEEGRRKGGWVTIDALARLVGREWRLKCEKEVESRRGTEVGGEEPRKQELDARMARLEQAVEELRAAPALSAVQDVDERPKQAEEHGIDLVALQSRVALLEQSLARNKEVPAPPPRAEESQWSASVIAGSLVVLAAAYYWFHW